MIDIMEIPCPRCHKNTIKILHREKSYGFHYARASSNRKTIPKLNPERYGLLSEKCKSCGLEKKELLQGLIKEGWL